MLIHGTNKTKNRVNENFIPQDKYYDLFLRSLIHDMYQNRKSVVEGIFL